MRLQFLPPRAPRLRGAELSCSDERAANPESIAGDVGGAAPLAHFLR